MSNRRKMNPSSNPANQTSESVTISASSYLELLATVALANNSIKIPIPAYRAANVPPIQLITNNVQIGGSGCFTPVPAKSDKSTQTQTPVPYNYNWKEGDPLPDSLPDLRDVYPELTNKP
jgi:hypothetical protein